MKEYTLTDAITDPNRPLTKAPSEWVNEVKQRRGSAKSAAVNDKNDNTKGNDKESETGVAQLDTAIDGIIGGIRDAYNSIDSLKKTKLTSKEKGIFDKVLDLLDTAVSPYVADIAKELDKLDEE